MIDFDAAWRHLQQTTKAPDNCQRWNKKAARYDSRDAKNLYTEAFVELAGVQPGETIFDMGCGTGTLAAEMATRGHKVIVGDFSSGMLAKLRENMALRDIKVAESLDALTPGSVFPLRMSWEDDWANYGLGKGAVDVAVASRSVITHDLEDSLKKLSAVARERACVTVCTGVSPRVDARVARAMGLELERHNDALFVFGIASDLGYEPTVSYIHSPRTKSYISPDEAYYSLLKTRDYLADTADQISVEESACRLRSFLADHLVEIDEDGAKRWTLDQPRVVPWAFISWDVGI